MYFKSIDTGSPLIIQLMDHSMKCLYLPLLLLALIFSNTASADEQAKIEAGKLLDAMQVQKTLDIAIPITLDGLIKQSPKLEPYKGVLLDFLTKHMSYEALKPAFITLYSSEFTAVELAELTAFYSTPTGKKLIDKQPFLYEQGSQIGAKRVQDNIPELEKMLSEEIARIKLQEDQN